MGSATSKSSSFGEADVLIRVETQPGGEAEQQVAVHAVVDGLGDGFEQRRVEVVGPAVSSELRTTGVIAVVGSLVAIVLYVWFRFDWQFALGAIVALAHDVILVAGIFAVFQLEFDLSIVAALLTVLGYSVNDTVVVSDRIRENLRRYKKMDIDELLNISINETLSRTVLTGVTTIAVLLFAAGFRRRCAVQLLARHAPRRDHRHLFVGVLGRAPPRLPRRATRRGSARCQTDRGNASAKRTDVRDAAE